MPQKQKTSTYPAQVARRAQPMKSFIAMEVLEACQALAAKGEDVISLSIGEPDFAPPKAAQQAAIQALEENFTQYTHSLGMPELREAICEDYHKRYGVSVDPDQVLISSGTSPAMLLAFGLLINPGDEVIVSDPTYPCYPNFIEYYGGKVVRVPIREGDGFQFRPSEVKKKLSPQTKAIFLNSPANPTGCLVDPTVMTALADLDQIIFSDEIYHGLSEGVKEHSILEFTKNAFVFNGFSKSYSMTGFRLGYLIAPKAYIPALQKMQQSFYISISSFIQRAGLAALKHGQEDQAKMRVQFAKRRQVMLKGVRDLGFGVSIEPQGAFYVFANAKEFMKRGGFSGSYDFVMDLLAKTKVGLTPGIDFGPGGEGYVRFSYATDEKKIRAGLKRIETYLKEL